MNTFKYQRLDLNSSAFRLVRLLKGTTYNGIECELIHTTLDENVIPYEAVSYTWDTSVRPLSIKIQGQRFPVTSSLWHLLESIRQIEEDRYLWIDAIAINQDDDLERGHQVQRMQNIYSGAERVLFYLGVETTSISILMESLLALQRHVSGVHWAPDDKRWKTAWEAVQNKLQTRYGHTTKDVQRQGLQELLERPWFRRVWVLQEVANARRALICCGMTSIRVQIFAMAPMFLGVDLNNHVAAIFELMPTFLGRIMRKPRDGDFLSVLLDFRWSQAAEPRDKIFALLGVCKDHDVGKGIITDYTWAESDIVRGAFIHILTRGLGQPLGWMQSVYFPDIDEFLHDLAPSSRKAPPYMEKFLIHILSFWNTEAVQSFFSRKENAINLNIGMVNAAASNEYNAVGMLILLLRHAEFDPLFQIGDLLQQREYSMLFHCFFGQFEIVCAPSAQSHEDDIVSVQQEDLHRLLFLIPKRFLRAFTLRLKGEDDETVELVNQLQRKMDWTHDSRGEPQNDVPCPKPGAQKQLPAVGRREIVQVLLDSRAHTEAEVWRLVWMTVLNGETDVAELLVDMKPEILNDHQITNEIIHLAIGHRHWSIIRCLLEKGGKITLGPRDPLSYVLRHGYYNMVDLFSAYPANVVGHGGRIPLHYAAELGDIHIIKFLLEQNADRSVVDESGRTALQVARDNRRSDIVGLLEAAEQLSAVNYNDMESTVTIGGIPNHR
ncbi:hypothetical protein E0Z10_g5282 [Xylaria hypoxylon]|uniref:Heterokaryon incompatibility domain-containing protein n=1 Tax=Xylaria hypoxylon TaxID=37992 RepID=A0A4Z0YWA4_9PEZI|nr:hypothetical protein E0Z10_g5282 [Xylaria hypoxylon]